ncbi:hypothetical protein AAFF_G00121250 [Aldrovandia affinis]|uniref:Period circadian-like C-terminal domain-containing protein n=1 Tax=Aldrovandia affinis TaxID=143900 RepID=A0AAD7RS73_9TELE|nr:hypothetical protein AAFF_G00121250 [Aldrovandia affinis]
MKKKSYEVETEANESSNQDGTSTSSDLLDLLLQEDSHSGTGSASSGSGSSGSNGCSATGSDTRTGRRSCGRTGLWGGLWAMQKHQPLFTEPQKRELSLVHPWIHTGRLPRAIGLQETASFDVQFHAMELSGVTESPPEEGALALHETTMEEDQEMTAEE